MYSSGFVCFLNTSEKRILFYKRIYDYFNNHNNNFISRDQLLSFGIKSGMTSSKTKDEIIGCLYAPFLIEPNHLSDKLYFTYNGQLKFSDLFTEGEFQNCEFPLTLEYKKGLVIFKRILTDSLDTKIIDILIKNKWSCNKSLKRLMLKAKDINEYLKNIKLILNITESYKVNNYSYLDLVKKYGRLWSNKLDTSCNLHSRSFFKSNLIDVYTDFFSVLLKTYKKPVDWSGIPIKIGDFAGLMKLYNIKIKTSDFIELCIKDCLLRYINTDYLTITSTGYFIMNSFLNENSNRLLGIIIRKYSEDSFQLNIAYNTKLVSVNSYLNNNNFKNNMRGWLLKTCSTNELLSFLQDLYSIFNADMSFQYNFAQLNLI